MNGGKDHQFILSLKALNRQGKPTHSLSEPNQGRSSLLLSEIQQGRQSAYIGQFIVYHYSFSTAQSNVIQWKNYRPMVGLIFVLSGDIGVKVSSLPMQNTKATPGHQLFYLTQCDIEISFNPCTTEVLVVEIPLPFLMDILPQNSHFLAFRNSILNQQSSLISPHFLPLTASMKDTCITIIQYMSSNNPPKIDLTIEIMQLIRAQWLLETEPKNEIVTFSESDQLKVKQARDYLENHFIHPPTIKQLARRIGSNEFVLKKVFKYMYGDTVYGFILNLKMQLALELLKNPQLSIQQVAEEVGYKHAQHFSTAFKKKFGNPPSQFRQ